MAQNSKQSRCAVHLTDCQTEMFSVNAGNARSSCLVVHTYIYKKNLYGAHKSNCL